MENGVDFCKLDLSDAYLHLEVDPDTAKIQALSTHHGTYLVKTIVLWYQSGTQYFS